jgi:GLPGLI family protein
MKNIILLILFINFLNTSSQVIEGRITYLASTKEGFKKRFDEDLASKSKTVIERSQFEKIYNNSIDLNVVLEFNSKIASYKVENKMSIKDKQNFNMTHIMSGNNAIYYTEREILKYENYMYDCDLFDECFLIQKSLPKWELTQESKIIGGYLCYKAIIKSNKNKGGNVVEVWYTPEIPIQYGIMQYYGLPGIILELKQSFLVISAIKIELNPLIPIKIELPKKVKKMSNEESKKRAEGFWKSIN